MTQLKIDQNALFQSRVFKQAIDTIGDTIEDMDIKIEVKHKKKRFFQKKKTVLPNSKLLIK